MKTPVTVSILGEEYTLASSESGEAQLREAAHRVDTMMQAISHSGKLHSRERIAVLAAIRFAAELMEAESNPGTALSNTQALEHPRLQALLEQAEALLSAHP